MAKRCQSLYLHVASAEDCACSDKSVTTEVFERKRERRRLQARHIWEKRPNLAHDQGSSLDQTSYGPPVWCTPWRLASFYMTTQKNPGGWRTPTRDRTGTGSNGSGRIVRHGLQVKPLHGLRVNGSSLYLHGLDQLDALSWQWIDQHENPVEQIWHTQQGTFRRKRPPDVRDDPMRGQ